jgi:hypothetical protein
MSAPLPIGDLEKLRARLANTTLDDARLPARLCELPLAGDKSLPLLPGASPAAEARAKLVLEGKAAVYLFNTPEDHDPDGILRAPGGHGSASENADDDQPPPLLTPSAGQAWLKYTTTARLRSTVGVEALGFTFDLKGSVALADYRLHPGDAALATAVLDDLRQPARFAFNLDDVRALRPGEALSLRLGGALELSLEVSASDALASGVGALAHLLEASGSEPPLGIRVDAGARLRARVQVEDHFLLAFTRDADGHRIVVRKASLRQRTLVPSLGLRVLLDPLDVSALVDAVLAALPRRPAAELLVPLRQQLEQRIEQVARSRLTAGFGFEYARLEEHVDLVAVRASEAWLIRHHADLVRGRLQPVLDGVRLGAEGVTLERFLDRRTLSTERSWGLSLGLGSWVVAGKDRRRMSRVIRSLVDGRQARAYAGLTGYDGQLGGSRVAWTASVRADTQGFAAAAVPRVSEYRFGLALTWTCAEQRLGEDELRLLLDAAVLWNAVSEDDGRRLAGELRPLLGQQVEAVVQLVLDDEVLRSIMRRAATAPLSVLAGPLAAAMPAWDVSAERHGVYRRRELYSKLWAQYLADPQGSPESWAIEAEHQLSRQFEATSLARLERQYQIARPYTFAGLIELNGGPATAEACRRFHQGLGTLGRAIEAAGPDDEVVARGLADLGHLFTQSHHVRAAGVYLLDGARATGLVRHPQRSLTVLSPGERDLVLGT